MGDTEESSQQFSSAPFHLRRPSPRYLFEPMVLNLVLVGYILVSCASCLPVLVVLTPIGAAGSADSVSQDLQGGYYVEYDDTVDE